MQLLDLITIFIFALGIVIMSLSFSGKGRNMKSFFAAGGAVPWLMSGLSLFMGFFSAGTFVVWGRQLKTSVLKEKSPATYPVTFPKKSAIIRHPKMR